MVDFPLPLAPTMTTSWPGWMVNDTSLRAASLDFVPGYVKEILLRIVYISFHKNKAAASSHRSSKDIPSSELDEGVGYDIDPSTSFNSITS
jgi:hypothetical protein